MKLVFKIYINLVFLSKLFAIFKRWKLISTRKLFEFRRFQKLIKYVFEEWRERKFKWMLLFLTEFSNRFPEKFLEILLQRKHLIWKRRFVRKQVTQKKTFKICPKRNSYFSLKWLEIRQKYLSFMYIIIKIIQK